MGMGIQPGALTAVEAAAYCGLSVRSFLQDVGAGNAPSPVQLTVRRAIWSRVALDNWLAGKAEQKDAEQRRARIMERIDSLGARKT